MFKNLKKKIEDVGVDLNAIGTASTLGSSLSSLKRSTSKTSAFTGSIESVKSESNTKTIHTLSILDDDDKEKVTETNNNSNFKPEPAAESNSVPESKNDSHPLSPVPDVELIFTELIDDTVSFHDVHHGVAHHDLDNGDEKLSQPEMTVNDVIDMVDESDASPVMIPLHTDISAKPDLSRELSEQAKTLENVSSQLQQREIEITALKNQISSRDAGNIALKTELDRLKDIAAKNRQNEEKLNEQNSKIVDLQQKLSESKLEGDSWKIAHDQDLKRLKEQDAAATLAAKKNSELETKFSNMKIAMSDKQKEIERFQEENTSLKTTVALLENQLDKLLTDYQVEKAAKESLLGEMQDQKRLQETVTELEQEIIRVREERERDIARIRADKDQELARVRQAMEEAARRIHAETDVKVGLSMAQLKAKEDEVQEAREKLQLKEKEIVKLESSVENMQVRMAALEEELEGKESNMAIFRRRTAKETETKLRERDKQIAGLERQVEDLLEKVNVVKDQDETDETSHQYMKNVILKFVAANSDERLQMLRAISVLLKLTHTEEEWLKETLVWKQSWLPGPKPELHMQQQPHTSNGHS